MERAQPRLAELGQRRLIEPGVVLVGTIRSDGSPRISGAEPLVLDGTLWLSMLWQSAKARDLLNDPRILVHSVITGPDGSAGELKIRGATRAENDPAVHRRYADMAAERLGWRPVPGLFHLFEVDIRDVTFIGSDTATSGQHVAMWPPPREFIRPGDTPTSLGDPQPVSRIIQHG